MHSRRSSGSSNKNNKKSSFKKRSAVGGKSREEGASGRPKERKKFSGKPKKGFQGGKSKQPGRGSKSSRPGSHSGSHSGSQDKRGTQQRGKSKVGAKPREMVANSWSAKGEAVVSNADGKRTLIWSGIPQEKAIVQVTHSGQHQNFGYVKEVVEASPYRIDPKCKRYDRCGGCPFMHMNKAGQDDSKLKLFMTAMTEAEMAWQDEQADSSAPPVSLTPVSWPTEIVHVGSDEGYRMVSKLVAGRAKAWRFTVGGAQPKWFDCSDSRLCGDRQ